jgi:PAS domain S-box-containing protein
LDYRYMFENSYDAVVVAGKAGNIQACNERAVSFFRYSDAVELENLTLHALVAGMTDSLLANIAAVIQERRYMRIQAFAIRKDETFCAVEIIVMGVRKEASETICYMIRDIQARHHAEQTLLSAFHAMDNTDSSIGIVDLDGKITYGNRKMISMLGDGDESQVIGRPLATWFDNETVISPMIESVMKGEKWTTEMKVGEAVGANYLRISVVPDINEDDQLLGMVISVVDVTDRRRAEMAEYQLERDRVMMESLSEACHAIGQPATVLLTSIEVLKDSPNIDTESRRQVEDMCYAAVLDLRQCLKNMNAARMSVKNSITGGSA